MRLPSTAHQWLKSIINERLNWVPDPIRNLTNTEKVRILTPSTDFAFFCNTLSSKFLMNRCAVYQLRSLDLNYITGDTSTSGTPAIAPQASQKLDASVLALPRLKDTICLWRTLAPQLHCNAQEFMHYIKRLDRIFRPDDRIIAVYNIATLLSTSLNRVTVLESFSLPVANDMVKQVCTDRLPSAH
ncbi:hypothetical protein CLF_104139 [Clonorchis sinensis]|uniref:Uncharacterized protein n=1 Tax=Clonorchis sinensis TaxID=79923 RepID=G7YB28_CLOSI|nr:hypothetical protein CLF_104139 [Clonorchis sinensis]